LKNFNSAFQEIYHTQRAYCIPDVELRERVLAKTNEHIVSKYGSFIDLLGDKKFSKNPSKYISYPVNTMLNMVGQLFDESSIAAK